jgi:integrase
MSKKTKNPHAKERRTFAKPSTQARALSKSMYNSGVISGLGTSHSYEASLKLAAQWLRSSGRGALHELTPKAARAYLSERSKEVGQKTLDRDRQALQAVLRQIGRINDKQRLNVIQAEKPQALSSRNYTFDQIQRIRSHQTVRNSFSTELAVTTGLRAHELLTLRPASERPMDDRPADPGKFREGVRYTVVGKGGLVREVSLPRNLAAELEARRLDVPIAVIDRRIHYRSFYDIAGGQAWSQSFSRASHSALGFSNGAHGLRHSYAQDRNREVQAILGEIQRAKIIVSQELGHFRPEITDTYLR